jgi:ribonuclease-3
MGPAATSNGSALESVLGHSFRDPALLERALWHPSYAHEVDGSRGNERLEFLGDAVLDLVVAELLYAAHPNWEEGSLTRVRAALVNTTSLAGWARELGFSDHLRLGRTERKGGGAEKDSILASLFEAILGALYLDGGLDPVRSLAARVCAPMLVEGVEPTPADPKTRFQEWAHAAIGTTPRYRVLRDSGVENAEDRFVVQVFVDHELYGEGAGRSKRSAERAAAETALERSTTP